MTYCIIGRISGGEAHVLKKVDIYTDGACSGNPGAGGYACILVYGKKEKEISGGAADTTNNRYILRIFI